MREQRCAVFSRGRMGGRQAERERDCWGMSDVTW